MPSSSTCSSDDEPMPRVSLMGEMDPAPNNKMGHNVVPPIASEQPVAASALASTTPACNGKGSWNESFADELTIRIKKMSPDEVAALEKKVNDTAPHAAKTDEEPLHVGVSDLRLTADSDQIHQKDLTSTSSAHSVSNDELLANAISNVKLLGPEVTTLVAPTAAKTAPNQASAPSSQFMAKISPDNPFYASNMTFPIAINNIVAYYHEASSWLAHWHETTPADTLVEISRKPTSTLNRIFKNLLWTWEFLLSKHTDWNLLNFPDQFFEDVLPLVDVTMQKVERMEEWKGCALTMGKALRNVEGCREMLLIIRAARVKEGKEKWAS